MYCHNTDITGIVDWKGLWVVLGFFGGVGWSVGRLGFFLKKRTHFVCRQIPFKKKKTVIKYNCLDFQIKEIGISMEPIMAFFLTTYKSLGIIIKRLSFKIINLHL